MPTLVTVAKTGEIAPGKVQVIETPTARIAVCNVGGTFYAIDDLCTHDGGSLDQGELVGQEIECPRHGARFNVTTGKPQCLPAVVPVKTYPVRVVGDEVQVEVAGD
ncbi:MAG: non-heme iron oxygenase ferredoxin subunit [Candidatus Omnitrophica bacterium]|nr:non-heme iron oxygenase ferredoxin subunit [Candidatus Omnitrophota bacterium]